MNKTILKNFAIDSRNKLMQDIRNKAAMLGITEEGISSPLSESTKDMLIFDIGSVDPYIIDGQEIKQYFKLKEELERRTNNDDYTIAYTTLIEEVAYTWFNRLIAIRFMEVNNYMPDKMRVLSSGKEGVNEPEFVTNYRDTSLDFGDKELEQLSEWKMDASALSMDKIFHLLFIKQCNSLNDNLPELFEKTDDYAELLLTISYNDPDGVLYKLIHDIPESYFDVETDDGNGQVEIIGWMYQYYNSEKKDEVFGRPKSQKIAKEDIPAATQLFTPDWIVRYMVENSLGRLCIEKLLASGEERTEKEIAEGFGWKYYIPEAEQDDQVKEQLIEIRNERKDLKLEDITFIDPAMGSFHIGVYAFDVFMQLYESQGYTTRDAAKSIIENNLYGIDIDKRAYQLSYFACMMKGRQYNRRILNGKTKTNLYTIVESNDINRDHLNYLGNNIGDKKEWNRIKEDILQILDIFIDAKEYGSILQIDDKYDFDSLKDFILRNKSDMQVSFENLGIESTQKSIIELLNVIEMLTKQYDIVVTNPPYLGNNSMNSNLSKYVKRDYPDSKLDLFAVFIELINKMLSINGISAIVTMQSWMFLASYEKLRKKLIRNNTIVQVMHMNNMVMRIAFGTSVTILRKQYIRDYEGLYHMVKYEDLSGENIPIIFPRKDERYNLMSQNNFKKISGMPITYWLSKKDFKGFDDEKLEKFVSTRIGLVTGDTGRFLRNWNEVSKEKIHFDCISNEKSIKNKLKWFPYQKGGIFRKWYGNNEFVVNWENDGYEMKYDNYSGKRVKSHNYNGDYAFKRALTWTKISSGSFSSRFVSEGYLYDDAGPICSVNNELILPTLGFLNSKIGTFYLDILSPTINYLPGHIDAIPYKKEKILEENLCDVISRNIYISKTDWDSFETSWDFDSHPLLYVNKQENHIINIEQSYNNWKSFTNNNFTQLKQNEEELNRIFIEIYGLQDELTPEVSDKDITITKIFDHKDEIYDEIKGNRYILTKEDVIKSFISYAVGCMFGRYSLDEEGLAYAGGDWDASKYESFLPTKDNIILITEEEYFQDDMVNRFIEFVRVTYGKETLDENLQFIADSLGGKVEPKEVIRNYFLKNFYKDHVQTYKKRPIYWLYDSGKMNGFKALIYMHRYDRDTTGKLRIDYLHKVQKAYELRMDNLKYEILNNKNAREVAEAEKELTKLIKQLKETKDYDEKIGHLAVERIAIDLDDGVKINYDKVQMDEKGKNLKILAKI